MQKSKSSFHSLARLLRGTLLFSAFALAVLHTLPAHASVTLLMEEPYGSGYGVFAPTGHAALYLDHVCAETPTRLRPCAPGEPGVVLSRYHHIGGYDWLAIPIIPYLYAVEDPADIPLATDPTEVLKLREAYWQQHLTSIAPPDPDQTAPDGEWTQLVGSAYDRKTYGFRVDSTPAQDARLMAHFNDHRNVAHFNLMFHNCADLTRVVLNMYYPHAIRRNYIIDFGMTTPKQVARSLLKYGNKHPEAHLTAFTILQVQGSSDRSHAIRGVGEFLLKSKKYIIPIVVLHPEVAGALALGYFTDGRLRMPPSETIFDADTLIAPQPEPPAPTPAATIALSSE